MSDFRKTLNSLLVGAVVALCVMTILLVLLLPSDSLVVDLIYQGF